MSRGAGKTLVGLDVAFKQTYQDGKKAEDDDGAVYLSGNGPLVAVLSEALAKDDFERNKAKGEKKKITDSRREVKKSIQMIHNYRDRMLEKIKTPIENETLEIDPNKALKNGKNDYAEVEHIAIFDEAQRAWTKDRLANYLKRGGTYGSKMKIAHFPMSESAFLIWSMDQRKDWATIICLVGGGQEINTGEAGISEWIKALNEKFPKWDVHISSQLMMKEYAEGEVQALLDQNPNVHYSDCLHLAVSLRSFRAEKLSSFVHALLDLNEDKARSLYSEIKEKYPIYLTRDLEKARAWLHSKVRGSERTGMLLTKEAARFKPLGLHVLASGDQDTVHWFLEDKTDVRASNFLEDAATEIQVQGLELDYSCLFWDADMRYDNGRWRFYSFNNENAWNENNKNNESATERRKYMLNAYRVLLTRARLGMVICVPKGNDRKTLEGFYEDSTRLPAYYDGTYEYLKRIGIEEI
ncbi:MAG: DNA/RNA helicase domain-containing protein [Candidatus Enteromonas sp.]